MLYAVTYDENGGEQLKLFKSRSKAEKCVEDMMEEKQTDIYLDIHENGKHIKTEIFYYYAEGGDNND